MTAWVLAFMVHSTLWLGLAWLLVRLVPRMQPGTRETIWYAAVSAGFIASAAHSVAPGVTASLWSFVLPVQLFSSTDIATLGGVTGTVARRGLWGSGWEALIFAGWISISSLLLLRYAAGWSALRARLARESLSEDSPEAALLRRLCGGAGLVRAPILTESGNLTSPIALGSGRRAEICVPTRAIHELDLDQFGAMLAHEVAHHARRDPLRLAIAKLLHIVFFFQPLLLVATRELHLAAEEQCDAWAAGRVGDRLAMASCLTEVAAWVQPRARPLPVVGLMKRRSQLARRVERLMEERRRRPTALGGVVRASAAVSVVALAPWLAPSVIPGPVPEQDEGMSEAASGIETPSVPVVADVPPSRWSEEHDSGTEVRGEGEEGGHGEEHAEAGARERAGEHGGESRGEDHGDEGGERR